MSEKEKFSKPFRMVIEPAQLDALSKEKYAYILQLLRYLEPLRFWMVSFTKASAESDAVFATRWKIEVCTQCGALLHEVSRKFLNYTFQHLIEEFDVSEFTDMVENWRQTTSDEQKLGRYIEACRNKIGFHKDGEALAEVISEARAVTDDIIVLARSDRIVDCYYPGVHMVHLKILLGVLPELKDEKALLEWMFSTENGFFGDLNQFCLLLERLANKILLPIAVLKEGWE